MRQFTENKTFAFTKIQSETLTKLKSKYRVNLQKFVRDAISEKIRREYPKSEKKETCPF